MARLIRPQLPAEAQPPAGSGPLFRLYAVLLLAKGEHVTDEDVHNALAAWMQTTDPGHHSLRPFRELDSRTQAADAPYTAAIRAAARNEGLARGPGDGGGCE